MCALSVSAGRKRAASTSAAAFRGCCGRSPAAPGRRPGGRRARSARRTSRAPGESSATTRDSNPPHARYQPVHERLDAAARRREVGCDHEQSGRPRQASPRRRSSAGGRDRATAALAHRPNIDHRRGPVHGAPSGLARRSAPLRPTRRAPQRSHSRDCPKGGGDIPAARGPAAGAGPVRIPCPRRLESGACSPGRTPPRTSSAMRRPNALAALAGCLLMLPSAGVLAGCGEASGGGERLQQSGRSERTSRRTRRRIGAEARRTERTLQGSRSTLGARSEAARRKRRSDRQEARKAGRGKREEARTGLEGRRKEPRRKIQGRSQEERRSRPPEDQAARSRSPEEAAGSQGARRIRPHAGARGGATSSQPASSDPGGSRR